MHRTLLLLCLAPLSVISCTGAPAIAPGEGRGVIAFDAEPPAGAELFQRPAWQVGDRQVLIGGGLRRRELTVTRADAAGYEQVETTTRMRMRRDPDLANLAELPAAEKGDEPLHVVAPRDVRFHWPLWVGKRWRCQYLDKNAQGMSVPLEVGYEVEGIDTVRVPAGTYRCLRILRTMRVISEKPMPTWTIVIWYAPEAGLEVRQLSDGMMIELVEWARGSEAPPVKTGG